jgi:predicted SnoaL-like aldol condensation-catalyzing enzyme
VPSSPGGAPTEAPCPPGDRTRFSKTPANGDLAWVFSSDYVVADIVRVVDGKIIERWDVVADGE